MSSSKRHEPLDLGPLPVDVINRTIGTDLEPGNVHMSGLAHKHAAEDHPLDYPTCRPLLADTIANPTYIGQAPKHGRNIELLTRVPSNQGQSVLVAVGLEPDEQGRYRVKSVYLVTEDEVQKKRQKGHIKLARKH